MKSGRLDGASLEWQTTFDAITDSVAILDVDGHVVQCNQAMAEHLGMSVAEVRGRCCAELLHGDCGWPADCSFAKALATRQRESMILPAGGRRLEVVVHPILSARGQIAGAVHVMRDITEQMRMEEDLRNEKAFSDAIVEGLPGVCVAVRADGSLLRWNKNALRVSGYSAEEFAARNAVDFFEEQERERIAHSLAEALSKGASQIEAEVVVKGGGKVPHHFSDVRAKVGDETCVLAVGIDVSERKRFEEAHDRLFNLSLDMMTMAGFDGYLRRVNPAWTRALGWTQEEMSAQPWLDFVHPDDQESTKLAGAKLLAGEPLFGFENRYRRRDGTYRWLSWNCIPIPERREIASVARDVTADREARERLRASEERYRSLVSHINGAVYRTGRTGTTEFVIGAERLCGYPSESLLTGRVQWWDLVHPEDRAEYAAVQKVLQEAPQSLVHTYRIIDAEGKVRWVDDHPSSQFSPEGAYLGLDGVVFDVTSRQEIEHRLRESERSLREAQAITRLGHWTWSAESRALEASDEFFRILGISAAAPQSYELLAAHLHPDDRLRVVDEVRAAILEGRPYCVQGRIRRQDGIERVIQAQGRADHNQAGSLVRLMGTVQDITEAHATQKRLAQLSDRLNLATRAGQIGIWDLDVPGKTLIFDDLIAALTGVQGAGEAVPADGLRQIVHPDDVEGLTAAVRAALANGSDFEAESRILRPDGAVRHLRIAGAVYANDQGHPARMLGVCWDVTKRAQLQASLANRERWAKGLQKAGAKLARCTNVDELFELAARAPVEHLGLKSAWIGWVEPGNRIRPICHYPPQPGAIRVSECARRVVAESAAVQIPDVRSAGVPGTACLQWALKHGFGSCGTYPIVAGEKCVAVLSIHGAERGEDAPLIQARPLLDVFCRQIGQVWERCMREDQLRSARREAESANQAKSSFLATMSHEIRTPMNAILGFSRLLQFDPSLSPQQRRHVDGVNRSGEHLLALINDILEMSKIESGHAPVQVQPMNLSLMVRNLEAIFRRQAEEKELRLRVDVAPDTPEWVEGDEGKLRQVLINLMGNALKFTERGWVELRLRPEPAPAGRVRMSFEIEDTGIGIDADDHRRIFDAFEQSGRGSRREGSTGLGLAISQSYVATMGGEIRVTSELGRGSTFRFELDLAPSAAPDLAPVPVAARLAPGHWGARALIVDDRSSNRELLLSILQPLGFELREAAAGEAGLAAFEEFGPDVVLLDTRMPGMSGSQMIQRMRELERGTEVPVIGVSAGGFDEEREMLDAGACDFVRTPFKVSRLLDAIAKHARLEFDFLEAPGLRGDQTEVKHRPLVLGGLSEGLVERLRRGVITCDTELILELGEEIASQQPETGAAIRSLVSEFRFDLLRAALEA